MSSETDRVNALATMLRMQVGTMDLDELERLDTVVQDILDERHSWARYVGDAPYPECKWCSVLAYADGSVQTRCNGRWSVKERYETCSRPPLANRCEACQDAWLIDRTSKVAAGLRDLQRQVANHTNPGNLPRTPGPVSSGETPAVNGVTFTKWRCQDCGADCLAGRAWCDTCRVKPMKAKLALDVGGVLLEVGDIEDVDAEFDHGGEE